MKMKSENYYFLGTKENNREYGFTTAKEALDYYLTHISNSIDSGSYNLYSRKGIECTNSFLDWIEI